MQLFWAEISMLSDRDARHPGRSKAPGSAFAWSLLEYAAREVWGLKALPEVNVNAAGKPVFRGAPGLHFSLSQTNGAVLAALANAPVGADVERRRVIPEVVRRRLFEAEHGDLELFELWTLRESWVKLTGAGDLRDIPFSRHGGMLIPPNPSALCRIYEGIPGCAAAVCTLRDLPAKELTQVDTALLLR